MYFQKCSFGDLWTDLDLNLGEMSIRILQSRRFQEASMKSPVRCEIAANQQPDTPASQITNPSSKHAKKLPQQPFQNQTK